MLDIYDDRRTLFQHCIDSQTTRDCNEVGALCDQCRAERKSNAPDGTSASKYTNADQQRLHPTIASFAAQARTAIVIRNSAEYQSILTLGEQAYRQVLEDGVAPGEAAVKVTQEMNQAINWDNDFYLANPLVESCAGVGTVTLWHLVDETHGAILDEIIRQFHIRCPTIIVYCKTADRYSR